MAAPAFGTVGAHQAATSGTINLAVPASVAANDIIVAALYIESTATLTGLPSGFAHATGSPVLLAASGQQHSLNVLWKRATGADAGTYNFTLSSSVYRAGAAERITGAVTSGDPWDVTNTAIDEAAGTTSPPVTVTTTGADRMLVHAASDFAGGSWTPSSGFTERIDAGDGVHTVGDKAQAVAGSSGSVVATCTGSGRRAAWLGALKPVGGAVRSPAADMLPFFI